MSDHPDDGSEHASVGLELDTFVQDHPDEALRLALEQGDLERALGAYRLLEIVDRVPGLPAPQARQLGEWLERAGMYLEAARVYRQGAEHDLGHDQAAGLIFRSACLLMGPARRPQPGADMLQYLAAHYPNDNNRSLAERIHSQWQSGDLAGLAESLEKAGVASERVASAPASSRVVAPPEPQSSGRFGLLRNDLARRVSPKRLRSMDRILWVALLILAATLLITHFIRHRYKSVDNIHPALLESPRQKPVERPAPIQFVHGDYQYSLLQQYHYAISGLIVGKNDYTMLGLARKNAFLMDLCLIWGDNVGGRFYQHEGVEIEMHGNVCYFSCRGPICMRSDQLSNNHILTADSGLQAAFDKLVPGDQIRMTGWLVDGQVADRGPTVRNPGRLKTSRTRTDHGMGACEILYVDKLEVLARANLAWRGLYALSGWLLLLLGAVLVGRLALLPVGRIR